MKKLSQLLLMLSMALSLPVLAEEHEHKKSESHEAEADGHDEHADGEEHEKGGHEEEGGAAIGPDKGITEKGKLGFRLAPEAIQSFELKFQDITSAEATIDSSSLVKVKEAKSLFRQRDGWFKRIPADVISRKGSTLFIRSTQLQAGDKIVTGGVAFLRTAEIIGEEGASHSH
ncbi:MAG: hypothetical protein AB7K68_12795 [Bacteriovoracia bacterium]